MAIIYFDYVNHRGEKSRRRAVPLSVRFGTSEWHPQPQWLMLAEDYEKGAQREFAMRDMSNMMPPINLDVRHALRLDLAEPPSERRSS